MNDEILIYETQDQGVEVRLDPKAQTLWLNQKQMAQLFGKDVRTISEHLKNIYKEQELRKDSTIRKFRTLATEGKRQVERKIDHYNLDAIISVGYRVNSKKGTQFRIWATQRLREYLLEGYTLNQQHLTRHQEQLVKLEQTLSLFQQTIIDQANLPEAQGLVNVIADYTRTFVLLNQFDSERLPTADVDENIRYHIDYDEAKAAIDLLKNDLIAKGEATQLVGNEKDDSFAGVLGAVVQSFDGKYLYSSIEEQAAHLLYFVIKNHPFSDGNKRIGAFMFIWFLQRNQHHLKSNGDLKINDNALVAIALLVAQSDPSQKSLMINLIMNLIR